MLYGIMKEAQHQRMLVDDVLWTVILLLRVLASVFVSVRQSDKPRLESLICQLISPKSQPLCWQDFVFHLCVFYHLKQQTPTSHEVPLICTSTGFYVQMFGPDFYAPSPFCACVPLLSTHHPFFSVRVNHSTRAILPEKVLSAPVSFYNPTAALSPHPLPSCHSLTPPQTSCKQPSCIQSQHQRRVHWLMESSALGQRMSL